jgi:hypothetical protein
MVLRMPADVQKATIKAIITAAVAPDTLIRTDEAGVVAEQTCVTDVLGKHHQGLVAASTRLIVDGALPPGGKVWRGRLPQAPGPGRAAGDGTGQGRPPLGGCRCPAPGTRLRSVVSRRIGFAD